MLGRKSLIFWLKVKPGLKLVEHSDRHPLFCQIYLCIKTCISSKILSLSGTVLQEQGSICWKPQLIQLWNLQPTIKPCISPRTHTKSCEPQKISELNYRDNLLLKQDTDQNHVSTWVCVYSRCPSVLGELLPARGCYYWETNVSQSTAYRLGVAYSTTSRESSLGENTSSWCLQCVITPAG